VDEFPELEKALRYGDLLTGRLCCAQLFDFDAGESARLREQRPKPRNEICAGGLLSVGQLHSFRRL